MKLYEIRKTEVIEGWPVDVHGAPAVTLGEEGRGRALARLPLVDDRGQFLPASSVLAPCLGAGMRGMTNLRPRAEGGGLVAGAP